MTQVTRIAAAAALALAAARASAQTTLTHAQSVYADDQNVALKAPEGVACRDGSVVVSDTGNGRLVRFAAKNGSLLGATVVKVAEVKAPGRVQLDAKGNALVLDQRVRRIARIGPADTFASWVEVKGAKPEPVIQGFKLDAADGLWILDGAGKRVLALDAEGSVRREVALPPGTVITDFSVEAGETLYAVDGVSATVYVADKAATAFQPLSKSLKEYMSFPAYVAGRSGSLLLLDLYGHGIVTVTSDGTYRGRQLAMGWSDGLVYYPTQLCVTDSEVVVADRYNNRVQVFAAR